MKTSTRIAVGVLCLVSLLMAGSVFAAAPALKTDPLAERFANPPDVARPHTWWHWMNGNVSRQGITKDLEGMKRVDIGGLEVTYSPADHSGLDFADLSIIGENGRFLR